eukprot:11450666-Heterocapsa_arctica.AAC.1
MRRRCHGWCPPGGSPGGTRPCASAVAHLWQAREKARVAVAQGSPCKMAESASRSPALMA